MQASPDKKLATAVEPPSSPDGAIGPPWRDGGSIWFIPADEVKRAKRGLLTSTMFPKATGLAPEWMGGPVDAANYIRFGVKLPVTNTERVANGRYAEPSLCQWYHQSIAPVEDPIYARPKDMDFLGSLADRMVGSDGLLECKYCEEDFPPGLLEGRIYMTWFCQLQTEIYCYKRKWVDLLVYSNKQRMIFLQRHFFDQVFWETVARPRAYGFYFHYMQGPVTWLTPAPRKNEQTPAV